MEVFENPDLLAVFVAGLFGLLIGSFLNVCIYRLPRDLSVVRPRSHCPICGTSIAWYDNVPVLSWVLLTGRCRKCRTGIPLRYPIVELLTSMLFICGVVVFGSGPEAWKFCTFAALQVGLIFTDLEERILPDEFTLGGTLAGIVFAGFVPPESSLLVIFWPEMNTRVLAVTESALSAGLLALVLWGIGKLYHRIRGREGLGFGDVKLVACIGAFLGLSPALLAIAAGSVLGSITGIAWILITRKDASTYELPFGSFLGIGAIVVALLRPAEYVL